MTKLTRKDACRQCPFRRKSAPGWLGDTTPEQFLAATIHQDEHMPCHMAINYEKADWVENQLPKAAHCAGSLIFMRNQLKRPIDKELCEMMDKVEPDIKNIFQWPHEFLAHHNQFKK